MHSIDTLHRLKRNPETPRRRFTLTGGIGLLLVCLLGFALVFTLFFGDRLRPRLPVVTAPVVLLPRAGEAAVTSAVPVALTMVAQASGWIEPDPFAVVVPARADGVVESVHVREGDLVEAGQLIVRLDDTDVRLALQRLQAEQARAVAARQQAEADWQMASTAVHRAEAQLVAAVADAERAADVERRFAGLGVDDLSVAERQDARYAATAAAGRRQAAEWDVELARQTVAGKRAVRDQADAVVQRVDAELARMRLDVERMTITAPVAGRVLERFVEPGMLRMAGMEEPGGSAVVRLYDPMRLQVRVDVALSDLHRLTTGMPARISTAAFPDLSFTGRVERLAGAADITRNTVQVKVALRQPPERLRPEMLCRVEFLGSTSGARAAAAGAASDQSLWVDEQALVGSQTADGSAQVWVVDSVTAVADLRALRVAGAARQGMVEVIDGVRAGEQVVVRGQERLKPGVLVRLEAGGVE